MNCMRSLCLLVTLLAMPFVASAAHADSIQITLTQTSQIGAAGTTITFDATLTNLSPGTIFLNGDSATTSLPFLTVGDNPFLSNAPLSLAPGASSGPFALFNVFIAPGIPKGTFGSNNFSILGGTTSRAPGDRGARSGNLEPIEAAACFLGRVACVRVRPEKLSKC